MSTSVTPVLDPLDDATTIEGVVQNLDSIIDWGIQAASPIGYFAVLYKRGTVAVEEAIAEGKFEHPEWVAQFDVVFANRYFAALNAYFHPAGYDASKLTLPWEVAFNGARNASATLLQHMIASLNAHICYDLGVALVELSANELSTIEHDFKLVNDLVSLQTPRMLHIVQQRSPGVRWIRRAIPREAWVIKRALIDFRKGAWMFAIGMATQPATAYDLRVNKLAWTAGLGAWYLNPPKRLTPISLVVHSLLRSENHDVAGNLRALAGIADRPDKRSAVLSSMVSGSDS
ncbi:DUF5995 family protein [Mycolicibacterium sp. 050232]|uniref:DUF5995 family protein n=1 Tax=Mycolicibacterium sp. 050232 TaxID=3113982 RepID=UPI002E2BE2FB|nr:DUF5995 family protein [Mycolicibacterium sp. 050232]MED5810925.1 DUF5995 family protein [Mycolicibacterium sp. 050232]